MSKKEAIVSKIRLKNIVQNYLKRKQEMLFRAYLKCIKKEAESVSGRTQTDFGVWTTYSTHVASKQAKETKKL